METEVTFSKVTRPPTNSRFYVSNKYESLDYDQIDNLMFINEEEERGKSFIVGIVIQRVIVFMIIGVLTGVVGTIIEIGIKFGSSVRFSLLYEATYSLLDSNFPKLCGLWILSIFIPIFIASLLVGYGEPLAQGGGAHIVISYLNGVKQTSFMKYKVVIIKITSLILAAITGMPIGKEGPLVFMGCVIGSITPFMSFGKFQPFAFFQRDSERRNMGTAGTAAGFTAAFGTPIAGIMIAFEENLSLWGPEMPFLIFVSAINCGFTLSLLVNFLKGCIDCVATKENIFLESMKHAEKSFMLSEIPIYVLFGLIGGILGAIWNLLIDQITDFRNRIFNTPAKKLIEITLIVILNGIIQVSLVKSLEGYCIQFPNSAGKKESPDNPSLIQLRCKEENEFSASGLFFQNTGGVFRSLFTENESHIGLLPLAILGLYYYFGTCLLVGCQLCNGIFTPHIVVGNIWGRMIAEMLNKSFPNSVQWARPNKFALLCGASQLCGTLSTTFTICVMMLESCNNVTLAIPIFIVVFTSRLIGNFINIPMVPRMNSRMGIPLLEREPPPLLTHIKVKDIISPSTPIFTLPITPSYRTIRETLSNNSHNGFPIVSNGTASKGDKNSFPSYGTLKGLILRSQIMILLKYQHVFNDENVSLHKKMSLLREEYASELMDEPMKWPQENDNNVIDLTPYMDPTPQFVHLDCSMSNAYRTFSALGLRHLIIVNDQYSVVGIITRKDLSIFRFIRYGPSMNVMKLPIRNN